MNSSQVEGYYNQGREESRLKQTRGLVEYERAQELMLRYLPNPPATVLDIGGGAGIYALWLAKLGYAVHLVDLMPLHVEQAKQASEAQPDHPLASVSLGNALALEFPDASADAVLLFGPLYHLTERADRVASLREARRVLRPGGWLFAATISRYASFLDGLGRGFLSDPQFASLVAQDVVNGQHRNPTGQPGYFTTAFFHHPDEIRDEVLEAGLHLESRLAIEGPAAFTSHFELFWQNEATRENILSVLRTLEAEPTMLGATAHLMTIARKV